MTNDVKHEARNLKGPVLHEFQHTLKRCAAILKYVMLQPYFYNQQQKEVLQVLKDLPYLL
jgi:hypothetical protein